MSYFPIQELSVPLEVGPAEFRKRLAAGLVPSRWQAPFRDKLVGRAAEDGIRIRRARTLVSNDLAPEFSGQVTRDGRFLRGVFRVRPWVRAALVVSLLALAAALAVLAVTNLGPGSAIPAGLAVVAVAGGFGALVARLGWMFGRSDIDRITAVLRAAARRT